MRKIKDRPFSIDLSGESRTEQSHINDADINQIMKKALAGIPSNYIREYEGHYGDATSVQFYDAQVIVANGKSMFEDLPSDIRNRFKNDPGKFLDFVQDPANAAELVKLKLATAIPTPPVPPGTPDPLLVQPTAPDKTTIPPAPAAKKPEETPTTKVSS